MLEVCALAGLNLDPWQAFCLTEALGEREDGRWASFEVGVEVPRQNGKGGLLEGRELGGLFVLGEKLITHSAHQFDTSLEAFRRLLQLIESAPDLDQMVKRVSRSHGEEGIELKSGQRIRFRTRTKGGGRGFSGDCVILDEAMILPESSLGSLMPTLSAQPNPQLWYTGSAVDQNVHEHGVVFTRLRARGHRGDDPSLAWFEWGLDGEIEGVSPEIARDPDAWAAANPGLGIRITTDYVANEQRSLDPRTFAVERLGVGDWPTLDSDDADGITGAMWRACLDEDSTVASPLCFAVDVRPDRSYASIGVAGARSDGLFHLEMVDRRAGTAWLVDRLLDLVSKHKPVAVVLDQKSPAASLTTAIEDALSSVDVQLQAVGATEHAKACGKLFDSVDQRLVRHIGQQELTSAVRGAARRPLGDAWAWSRSKSAVDISPLVAITLALWGVTEIEAAPKRSRVLVAH